MPSVLVPHASASHRVACIRLYRALRKQTALLQTHTNKGRNDAISSIVQFRFRRDRRLASPTQVANGLNTGYAMLDLVHACNNKDADALQKLAGLVQSVSAQAEAAAAWRSTLATLKKAPAAGMLAKIEHVKAVGDRTNHVRYHASTPVLERPLPLSEIQGGTRRVPNLVTAQGIPFLRYSKPQPISLSRVIRQKVLWNEKNWTQRGVLEEKILIAGFENTWDRILREEHGIVDGDAEESSVIPAEPSWTHEFRSTDAAISEALRAKDRKNAEMGVLMWEVVKKETALKRQEKTERRAARKAMQMSRQEVGVSARSEAEHTHDGPL